MNPDTICEYCSRDTALEKHTYMCPYSDGYEYHLKTWGGFYNKEHSSVHGKEAGDFWFNTWEDRDKYLHELKLLEKKHGANHLAYTLSEGHDCRKQTVVRITANYLGVTYNFEYNFGYGYGVDNAEFMFTAGNYGCDCNLSLFIQEKYPEFPELACGEKVEHSFTIEQL